MIKMVNNTDRKMFEVLGSMQLSDQYFKPTVDNIKVKSLKSGKIIIAANTC